jgi:hypothetical protein
MKYKTIIITLSIGAASLFTGKVYSQDDAASIRERNRKDSLEVVALKEKQVLNATNKATMSEAKLNRKETKAKAKEAKRLDKEANAAARESRKEVRAEEKAQKQRARANKQAAKASKAREKSDKNEKND